MADSPVVYLFHGNDEAAMKEAVANLQSKLGDATTAEMNMSRFDGPIFSFDQLSNAAQAAPFLASRRLIVVSAASKAFSNPSPRERFIALLDQSPQSTALVILENPALEEKSWLLKWAKASKGRAYVKEYDIPQGAQMVSWIRERAKALGGEMQPQTAAALAQLIGSDKQAAENEIEKLLAHASYQRPIEAADVAAVSLPTGEQGDYFGLIDAVSTGNGKRAIEELESLMQERDLLMLFFSLVGHFRLLLQIREMLDEGKSHPEIMQQLNIRSSFRAEKLATQARRFSMSALESIYRRLLELDEQAKTGEMEWELAMESFVASLSAQAV